MKRRDLLTLLPLAPYAGFQLLRGQDRIDDRIVKGDKTFIAIPDFRGKGVEQSVMDVFNETVWNDVADSGILEMVAKSLYPLDVPQKLDDVKLAEWAGAPVNTNYLGIGSAEANGPDLLLHGWLVNAALADAQNGQLFDKRYFGSLNAAGARKVGHEYAADILKSIGVPSLAGSKLYFVSDRTSTKEARITELWSMDHDGQNQEQVTRHRSIVMAPTVSRDGTLLAYTLKNPLGWEICLLNTVTRRQVSFINPPPTTLVTPEFSPDNKQLWFSMALEDNGNQIMVANVDGSQRKRISTGKSIEVSPRLNPKTGEELLFVSGRLKTPQLFRMRTDGTGIEMLTPGNGDVANPSWSPNGRLIAFAWTAGLAPGGFNIFVRDVSGKSLNQLTHDGRGNENPWWAPDGVHLVFSSKRTGNPQIHTMLADGTRVKQLTSSGSNTQPVWAAKTE